MYSIYSLADYLKTSVESVLEMSQLEFKGWFAFLKIKNDREKKANDRATTNRYNRKR